MGQFREPGIASAYERLLSRRADERRKRLPHTFLCSPFTHVTFLPAARLMAMPRDEFRNLVKDIIRDPDDMRLLERGRRAYWDHDTGTVVIFGIGHKDLGTAFVPKDGYYGFFLNPNRLK